MPRQFIAAKFRKDDRRTFTYHWDHGGEIAPLDVVPGDEIKVPDRSGDGWKRVYVSHIVAPEDAVDLPFATKAVLGRAEPETSAPAETPTNMAGFTEFLRGEGGH